MKLFYASKIMTLSSSLLITTLTFVHPSLASQPAPSASQVHQLNNQLLRLHGQFNRAQPAEAARLRGQAAQLIQERANAFISLIRQNAAEALKNALPEEVLSNMVRAFPDSASLLESHGTWQGTLEYLIADYPDGTHRAIRRMKTGKEVLEIEFAGPEPPRLKSGDILKVRGVRAGNVVAAADGNVVAAADGSTSGTTAAPAACSTTGTQSIATILVEFPSYKLSSGVDQELLKGILYGNSYSTKQNSPDWSVDDFWQQNSDGQTYAPFSRSIVAGPFLLNKDYNASGTCDYMGILNDALAAADSTIHFPDYSHVMIVLPNNGACNWAGLGTLGCWSNTSTQDGSFTAGFVWERSDQITSRSNGVRLSTHELGHNLTMNHARSRAYPGPPPIPLGSLSDPGVISEYGDSFSTMGYWNFGFYSAHHALQQLGWLQYNTNVQVVETAGAYAVQAYETRPAGVKALKIRRGTGNDAWLWLEFRQNSGIYDSQLNPQVFTGALIHYQDSTTGSYTDLLDFTPTDSFSQVALAVGQTWQDPYSNLSLSIDAISGGYLYVTVNYGPTTCVPASPTVSISPLNQTLVNGTATYSVTVRNNDNSACSASTFTFSSDLPSGWSTLFSPQSAVLNPGESATVQLTKTPPQGTETGTYDVNVVVSHGSLSASSTASVTVPAPPPPLSVDLSVSPSSVPLNSTVRLNATILSNGTPVPSASVTFTVTDPKASSTAKTVTSGQNGTAVWNYKVFKKDPTGVYTVSATATYGGQASVSNTVSFTAY